VFVVTIAHLFVPYVVLIAGSAPGSGEAGGSTIGAVLAVLGFVLVVLGGYVLPVALTNFALSDRLGAAFEVGTALRAAFTGPYVLAVVFAVVVGGVLGVIGGLLTLLIVGTFLTFYVQVVVSYLIGSGCDPALCEQRAAPMAD
jgi:hypothetical protein